jgi:Domain of unknown function (DUF4234)
VANGNTGPLGQQRGILFVILISIVTLGIYGFYWVFKTCEEMKEHRGEGIGGVIALVIQFVFAPINWFLIPSELGKTYSDDGREAPLTGWTGLWMFLPLIGFIIWVMRVQGGLNRYWASKQEAVAGPAEATPPAAEPAPPAEPPSTPEAAPEPPPAGPPAT